MSLRFERCCAALAAVWSVLQPAGAAGALSDADADGAAPPGLVIEESDVPRAADGRLLDEVGRGARARVQLPAAVERRLGELSDERARAAEATAFDGERDAPAASLQAPARMDAGDSDPDRLHTLPPPPVSR